MIFKRKNKPTEPLADDKELIKLAKKYKRQLENANHLPENSMEMFRIIKKAGL